MKKQRIISLLLAIFLLLQLFCTCAGAVEEEVSQEESTEETEAAEELTEAEEEEPTEETESAEELTEAEEEENPAPTLECKGAILMELNSDTTVYELNADERLYPASLTKIMTCLIALEKGTLSDVVTVDGSLFADMDSDASALGLLDGEQMTLEELLYCVMVPSGNDASLVVAQHIGGSVQAFVDMMNAKAAELGCTGTHFMNPDGLHDDNHYTTARDMAIIARAALQSETFRTICGTATHEVPATNLSSSRMIYSTNYFMSTIITGKYYWEKVSGVKTGFTTPAGRCLVTLVEEGSFSYLSVVLGAETPYDENGEPVYGSFTESRKLLEYGLNNFTFVSVLSHLNPVAQVPVNGGEVNSVVIAPTEDLYALLPADFDEKNLSVSYSLNDGGAILAPFEANAEVGTVTVTYAGQIVGETKARAIAAVGKRTIFSTPEDEERSVIPTVIIVIIAVAAALLIVAWVNRQKAKRRRRRKKHGASAK